MTTSDFIKFKNQSYLLKLKQFAASDDSYQQTFMIFGGTGAVGGQVVIELIQSFEFMMSIRIPKSEADFPVIVVTGLHGQQIKTFINKLFKAFEEGKGHGFEQINDSNSGEYLTLKRKSGIEVKFFTLVAKPEFKTDLSGLIAEETEADKIVKLLQEAASQTTSPFSEFIEQYKEITKLPENFQLSAVISGIPIPSVAAYHFGAIDSLLDQKNISRSAHDKSIERSIKIAILRGLAEDFGQIKQKHAKEVLIAHTTAVGGMYNIIDGEPIISLGFAHSSLGDLLKEKQYYANQLTIQYADLGLKILITAAAIGIDYIHPQHVLKINSGIYKQYQKSLEAGNLPFRKEIVERGDNRIFPALPIAAFHPILDRRGEPVPIQRLDFDKSNNPPPAIKTQFAIRSGENGIFSIDNAYALYLTMKVASPEELAHILTFNAIFGDDEQKPWFDEDGVCPCSETDNSSLIFSLLGNRAEFRNYQTSAFTLKAYQDLGSNKHQGELHTTGIYMLLHRLKSLSPNLIYKINCKYRDSEVMEFVDKNTQPLLIEDIISYDPKQKAKEFAQLFTLNSPEQLADFIGFKGNLEVSFTKTFFQHLLNVIKKTIYSITSMGTPIIFESLEGREVILAGPYLAPADLVLSENNTLIKFIESEAREHRLNKEDLYEWLITNQGFVDLRPKATIVTCRDYRNGLNRQILSTDDLVTFEHLIRNLQNENNRELKTNKFFTTSGIVAFIGRYQGLYKQLETFNLTLGSYNAWKALFPTDDNNNHPVIPGIVEGMRMYFEGLGKITGTEMLYPNYGYYH